MKTRQELDAEYDASLQVFYTANQKHKKALLKYRMREIGDEEYLDSRREYDVATQAADSAEMQYIASVNALASPLPSLDEPTLL